MNSLNWLLLLFMLLSKKERLLWEGGHQLLLIDCFSEGKHISDLRNVNCGLYAGEGGCNRRLEHVIGQ